jgi:xanthine dehydrogenase accessory factor
MVDVDGMLILERIATLRREQRDAVLVTVTAARGSTPRKAGARMLVFADGSAEGTIGGGKVEHQVRGLCAEVLASREARAVSYDLGDDLGMSCGGSMSFFLEPILTDPPLIIFGCGHVGTALCRLAKTLGFSIVAVDDLVQNANPTRLPEATRIVNTYDPAGLADLPFGPETFVVIVTREHRYDQQLLELCLAHETRYVGVIGSRRKAETQRQRLMEKGLADAIARVHCPIGLDIGAETPEEIAVSIAAELIAVRRNGPEKP